MESSPAEIFDNSLTIENPTELEKELLKLPTQAGLVLFADNQDLPILLLSAANIRRTVKNKLAEKADKSKKADLKSITTKIYYSLCPCKFRLAITHYKAVKKVFASNYKDHIVFVRPWFISINLGEKIPSLSITKKPIFKNGEKILGPIPGQRSATAFLKALEDAFKLCKRNDLVSNLQRAKGCPYIQMDACCGICGGKVSPENYKIIIKDAFEAGTNPAKTVERFQADMQMASKELNFEKAAELKKKIEKLSALKKQTYKWTGDLEKLKIVHIDKSAKIKLENSRARRQTFAVFVMNFFEVVDLGDFVIENIEKIAAVIENALAKLNSNRQETCDPSTSLRAGNNETLERFAIVSYFLYRTKPAGIWINASDSFNREELQKFDNTK
jgi:excinuclease UvrABC nuclease subunit